MPDFGPLARSAFQKNGDASSAGHAATGRPWGVEEVRHFLKFVEEQNGVAHTGAGERALELACGEAGALAIGAAINEAGLVAALGEKLLRCHLDHSRARTLAETLQDAFSRDRCPLSRREIREMGLPVAPAAEELEELLGLIWQDLAEEMKCHKPFDPLELVFRNSEAAAMLGAVLQVQWPANAPVEMGQQMQSALLQQARAVAVPAVDCTLFQATLESVRCRSELRLHGKINAARQPDMSIAVHFMRISAGWKFSKNLDAPAENSAQK